MIRGWSFLASPSVVGLGPPLTPLLGESLAAADTAASRIAKAAVTSFIVVVCVYMWVLSSRLDFVSSGGAMALSLSLGYHHDSR